MLRKFIKVVDIFFGVVVTSILAYTIRQILIIYLGNNGFVNIFLLINNFMAWITFVIMCFIWIRVKKPVYKIVLFFLLILIYLLGRAYAVNTYKSVSDARVLYNEAYFASGMSQIKVNDPEFLNVEKKYVSLLKEVSEKPKGSLVGVRMLWSDIYKNSQEFLDYDEKLLSGQIVATEDEVNEKAKELTDKRDSRFREGYIDPDWVSFFFIQ